MQTLVDDFNKDIVKIIHLIESSKEDDARKFFNDIVFVKYSDKISDKKNPLIFFEIFFFGLDEYFNDKGAKILGVAKKDYIIENFYSDYQEDLTLAKQKMNGIDSLIKTG